ncbi:hypothetical protein AAGW05_04280 [Arthrobacter sp. LAPM80]|uniref:hypothetical protein n=1 Tax=Arthrobacter sp. LAPM80 TaxID=3141788 RepID=UPI00398A7A37
MSGQPKGGADSGEQTRNDFILRILRRETHSARSSVSVATAIVIAAAALYGLLEMMLAGLGQPAWLAHPLDAFAAIADLPGATPPVLLGAAGALVALLGVVLLCNGLIPGRRARHVIADPRIAIVVEDEVIAAALAKCARMAAGVTREQVVVVVSARQVQVNIRPTSGIRLSENAIQAAIEAQIASMGMDPVPAVTVKLADSGVIGV